MRTLARLIAVAALLSSSACRPTEAATRPVDAAPVHEPRSVADAPRTATPKLRTLVDEALPESPWPTATPESVGLDPAVLEGMLREAEASDTSALLVVVDGKTIVERYFDRPRAPIETMSVTKSIVGLAIGMLVADGKIASLDAPMSTWLPGWKKGRKRDVTLRHVLTHTSGLEHRQGARVLNEQSDRTAFAANSPVVETPGAKFSYNNEAVQLLDAVVRAAAGKSVDAFLAERLFAPLGITEWSWARDPAGNVQTFYGLSLHARDLAKIGALLQAGGKLGDAHVVPADFLRAATTEQVPGSGHGLLWWLRRANPRLLVRAEDVALFARQVEPSTHRFDELVGRSFPASGPLWLALGERTDEAGRARLATLAATGVRPFAEEPGALLGYAADGWLGQQLVVFAQRDIVVVRQHEAKPGAVTDMAYNQAHGFAGLAKWIEAAIVAPK